MGTSNFNIVAADSVQVGGIAQSGALRAGNYTAVTADDTAGTLDIVTGLATVVYFSVEIYRSGVPLFSDQAVSEATGTITVADGAATYVITADDELHWVAVGS